MKKIICGIIAVCSALTLCSCASSENTEGVNIYTGKPVLTGIGISHKNETIKEPIISDKKETAQSEEKFSEASDELPAESVAASESSDLPESWEVETSDQTLTAESEDTDEPAYFEVPEVYHPEGLDDFYIDEYAAYRLSKEEREFTENSVFMGDSICRGFDEYKIVKSDNVLARGSVAARSFFDYEMYYDGSGVTYAAALSGIDPEYVFLSMGMNDINITDEDTYCENYRSVIDTTLENSDAAVYVCAITPINCNFSTNYRIDCFNVKLEQFIKDNYSERVYYVDFAKHLKDSEGNLKECFNGGDGIHLSPYAYYVALWEMNRTMIADGVKQAPSDG